MTDITWYRGDCHVHSKHSSGGELTPAQAVAAARAAGLDFVAGTEHNTAEAHELWRGLDSADLLVLLGQEVVTRDGHWLALGLAPGQLVGWDYGAGEGLLEQQLAEVHRVGGLCVVAHPYAPYPTGTFRHPHQSFDAVEVWNGPWTSDVPWQADNEAALADWARTLAADIPGGGTRSPTSDIPETRWRPAIGNSDTHLHGQIAVPHTVVAADRLSADALLAGIRAGRSWIAESAAVRVSFSVSAGERCAGIGERLLTAGETAVARVEVRGVPSAVVTFHNQDGPAHAGSPEWRTSAAESAFLRIEIRHPEGHMAALTNPIILL